MARQIDLDQLMKYPLRRGSEHCDEKNADPRFLNGVESILEWAQTLPTLTPPSEPLTLEELKAEAKRQGYKLIKDNKPKFERCLCGHNVHQWVSGPKGWDVFDREREKELARAAEPEQYSLNVDHATGEIVEDESEVADNA